MTEETPVAGVSEGQKNIIQIIYFVALGSAVISIIPALTVVGMLVWIGLVIFAYIKKGDTKEQAAISHYANFITLFWIGLIGFVLAVVFGLVFLPIAIVIGLAVFVWQMYRLIKGLVRIMDNRAYV